VLDRLALAGPHNGCPSDGLAIVVDGTRLLALLVRLDLDLPPLDLALELDIDVYRLSRVVQ
jgi:hypothetical protein